MVGMKWTVSSREWDPAKTCITYETRKDYFQGAKLGFGNMVSNRNSFSPEMQPKTSLVQEINWISSLSWIRSSEVEPVNQQVFNKKSCKSGLLINLFVLDAGRRTEKGEDIPYLAPS